MIRWLSVRRAGGILIAALLIMLVVHVLILMRLLPYAMVVLNTAGNLASGVTLEKLMFTPVTVLLTLLALRVAMEKLGGTQGNPAIGKNPSSCGNAIL